MLHQPRFPFEDHRDRGFEDFRPSASWTGEEITIQFAATTSKSDYGVPGSPVFTEIDDVEITSLKIFDFEVDLSVLPKDLQKHLFDLSDDVEFPS